MLDKTLLPTFAAFLVGVAGSLIVARYSKSVERLSHRTSIFVTTGLVILSLALSLAPLADFHPPAISGVAETFLRFAARTALQFSAVLFALSFLALQHLLTSDSTGRTQSVIDYLLDCGPVLSAFGAITFLAYRSGIRLAIEVFPYTDDLLLAIAVVAATLILSMLSKRFGYRFLSFCLGIASIGYFMGRVHGGLGVLLNR